MTWTKEPEGQGPGYYWMICEDPTSQISAPIARPIYVGHKPFAVERWKNEPFVGLWWPHKIEPPPLPGGDVKYEQRFQCEPREDIGDMVTVTYRDRTEERPLEAGDEVKCRHCSERMSLLGPYEAPYGLCPARMAEALGLEW